MNKIFRKTILTIIFTIVFSIILGFQTTVNKTVAFAENKETKENIMDKETKEGLNNLYDYINKMKTDVELVNELNPSEYVKSYIENGEGNISFSVILKAILSLLDRKSVV